MGRLNGRNAIVTGASRGLGRAIALALAAEGAAVAVVGRTVEVWDERLPGTIGETVRAIEAAGGRALAVQADLLVAEDRGRLVAEARDGLGPITILVNNAAFTAPGRPGSAPVRARVAPEGKPEQAGKASWPSFLGVPVRGYQRHFEMVYAAYELMQLVVPDMESERRGAIVNVSSGASRMPGEGPYTEASDAAIPGYGGSKLALEHLTQCVARELHDRGIPVNALSPSKPIPTPGQRYYAATWDELGSEADFAAAVVRLCLVPSSEVTGRVMGHEDVLNGSFSSYQHNIRPARR